MTSPPSTFTPGKVILSGEHAVVHHRPALALPLRAGIRATFTPLPDPVLRIDAPPHLSEQRPLDTLPHLLHTLRQRHAAFLAGTLPAAAILPRPSDLLFAAAALAPPPPVGLHITLNSQLPPGAGLGSSAAVILSLLKGLLPHPTPESLHTAALHCEHFQHGRSSGLDVAACLSPTLLFAHPPTFTPIHLPHTLPAIQLYATGTPDATTGECVEHVARTHPPSNPVWTHFETTTLALRDSLLANNLPAFLHALRDNHRLLTRIGVVPPPVAEAIARIEAAGGAAKICGAGSIRGSGAGTVLVCGPAPLPIPRTWQHLPVL